MAAHPLEWLIEPISDRADLVRKRMFGCEAIYLRGRIVAGLVARKEPWNGLLCPVEKPQHESIVSEFPALVPHPVLPKWLYLSIQHDRFEQLATDIMAAIAAGDPRFGVIPKPRSSRAAKRVR